MASTGAPPFRLDLAIRAPSRLDALKRVFVALKRIKAIQFGPDADRESPPGWMSADDPRWEAFLDPRAREHFAAAFDHDSAEGQAWRKLWALTPRDRRNVPLLEVPGPWGYDAVIGAIYGAEYLLVEIATVGEGRAMLIYEPLAGPFGGTEALVQLVEAFGQRVEWDSWHDGPPPRPVVGWDYAEARRRIAEGRGAD